MSQITVATADLRRALTAVVPHAATDKEDTTMHRVRLTIGDQNVTVAASNRYSAGLALVSVEEHDGELLDVDLSPQDVKEIRALFTSKNGGNDEEIGDTLELRTTDDKFRITDTSGLFPGKLLELPRYAVDSNFPNLRTLALKILSKTGEKSVERLVTTGSLVSLFKAAAQAYSKPLALEMTGEKSALIVSCGESFLGLLSPARPSDETAAEIDSWRSAWLFRLQESELATA